MMKMTGLSHLFKWENLHNWWLTKYFFAPLYIAEAGGCGIKKKIIIIPHRPLQHRSVLIYHVKRDD